MSDRISFCVFCCTGADGASEIHPFDVVPLSVLYPAIVWEALDAGEYKTKAAPNTTRRKTPTAAMIHNVLFCSITKTSSSDYPVVYSKYRKLKKKINKFMKKRAETSIFRMKITIKRYEKQNFYMLDNFCIPFGLLCRAFWKW